MQLRYGKEQDWIFKKVRDIYYCSSWSYCLIMSNLKFKINLPALDDDDEGEL